MHTLTSEKTIEIDGTTYFLRYAAWETDGCHDGTSEIMYTTPEEAYDEIKQAVKEDGLTWDFVDYETVEVGPCGIPYYYIEEIRIPWVVYRLLYACNRHFEELLDSGVLKNNALLRTKINETKKELHF